MMSLTNRPKFLRTILQIDAATCVATGLLMTAGAGIVSGSTQIPSVILIAAGTCLFPIAALIAYVASRVPNWPAGVWLVILGNIGWVLGSAWLLTSGAIEPNTVGVSFVLAQAAAVAVLAALEYMGLQRAPRIS